MSTDSPPRDSRSAGCGGVLPHIEGPTHAYMAGSAACFAAFNRVLATEYADRSLLKTHRLTVDTYAVQHPGAQATRREIQSMGLHLARLYVQLRAPKSPKETNDVMLGFSKHKSTLKALVAPYRFTMTIADVAPHAGTSRRAARVRAWAGATWADWAGQHDYIRGWVAKHAPNLV
ncbi:MAG: DUF5946 family protein [Pseudomonadota bacterium]